MPAAAGLVAVEVELRHHPQTEAGRQLARRLANPRLQDLVELSEDFTLSELRAPAAFHGKSLEQLALRNKYGVNLIAVKRPAKPGETSQQQVTFVPQSDYIIQPDDLLLLVGADSAIHRLPR